MKSPEEIKYTLHWCWNRETNNQCIGCPYKNEDCGRILETDALAYIRQLEQRLVEADKTYPRWIGVGERLPENGQKVIAAFRDSGGWIVDQARYGNGEFDFASWAYVWADNITHWTPLPEPPEVEEHE